jgi:hypothetical protein
VTALAELLKTTYQVHRLFVVDRTGVLTGVISAFDVVRKLRRITCEGAAVPCAGPG